MPNLWPALWRYLSRVRYDAALLADSLLWT